MRESKGTGKRGCGMKPNGPSAPTNCQFDSRVLALDMTMGASRNSSGWRGRPTRWSGCWRSPGPTSIEPAVLASGRPLVLDADALNLLAASPCLLPQAILTPHPGEAARLLACEKGAVQADRFAAAEALAQKFQCTVVLKGAGTIVAAPGEVPAVIGAGNPGMATGGMGDVLSGVIGALVAQGLPLFQAAVAGALLHSAAGDAAARVGGERGLLPSDLFPHLRRMANPG